MEPDGWIGPCAAQEGFEGSRRKMGTPGHNAVIIARFPIFDCGREGGGDCGDFLFCCFCVVLCVANEHSLSECCRVGGRPPTSIIDFGFGGL